ncbi:MAG: hypothetical protein ACRD3A_11515, partial [Terriglobales bacterium]
MKPLRVGLALLLFATFAWAQSKPVDPNAVTVIRAGVLIDGKSDQPARNQVIVVRGNRIAEVLFEGAGRA